MKDTTNIRKANIDDLDALTDLFDLYRVFYRKPSKKIAGKAFLKKRFENNDSVIFVCEKKGQLVGFTQLYPKFSSARMVRNWILNDLYVLESERKTGIAGRLIDTAVQYARLDHSEFIQLETERDNITAQRLYREKGFVEVDSDGSWIVFRQDV